MSEIDTPAVDSAVDVRPIDSDAGSVPVVRPVVVAGARSAEEIRADLAAYTVAFNNTEWSREVWLVNVGHTAVVVCESVPSLLAEVEAVKRDRARLIAELHGAHRERDSLRGVVQAVEAALRDIDKAVVTTDASKRLALFHATDTIRAALAAAADAPQPADDEALQPLALYVLDWLVRLKDGPRDERYEAEKPQAWERARAVVAAAGPSPAVLPQPSKEQQR